MGEHEGKRKSSSSADESHSAGWKLRATPVMSTDSSQVGVTLFPYY